MFKLVGGRNHQISCPVMGKKIMRKWPVTLLPGPNASRIACCLGQSTPPHVAPHGTNLKPEAFHDGACVDPLSFHLDMGRQDLLNGLFVLLDIFAHTLMETDKVLSWRKMQMWYLLFLIAYCLPSVGIGDGRVNRRSQCSYAELTSGSSWRQGNCGWGCNGKGAVTGRYEPRWEHMTWAPTSDFEDQRRLSEGCSSPAKS